MGLTYPSSLEDWQHWQDRQNVLRSLRGRLTDRGPTRGVLASAGPEPDVLVAVEASTPSQIAALLAPLSHLPTERLAVLAPAVITSSLPGSGWRSEPWAAHALDRRLDDVRVVVASGHFLPLGAAARAVACSRGLPFLTVQHGLLTPHSPPLARGTTLLAWSEADARFWSAGRDDVESHVVGSQLLWQAAGAAGGDGDVGRRPRGAPTYLGQLHGAELPRDDMARAAESFCRETGATYRAHPAERDRRSRRQHARWEASGITVETDGPPLAELATPVVSVFSTGVLEAAARGLPAWVTYPDPPVWLTEFWSRYGMREWGDDPTPAPALPRTAPARRVADVVGALL